MPRAHGNVLFDYQDGFRLPLDKDADFKHDEEGVSSELVQVSLGMSQRGRSKVGMWQVRVMRTMSSLPSETLSVYTTWTPVMHPIPRALLKLLRSLI